MMKRFLGVFALLATSAFAQPHPRHMFTPAMLSRIHAKVATNDPNWVSLKASCDGRVRPTAGTPDGLPPVYASRQPTAGAPPGSIVADYQGFGYEVGVQLAVCYYALNPTDPVQAAKYKAQAIKVALAASSPFAEVRPTVPAAGWVSKGISMLSAWYVTGDGGNGQARVRMTNPGLANGQEITISKVLGCPEANGTFKVAELTTTTFDLVALDGVTPIVCSTPGLNWNHNMASDAVYPIRTFGPVISEIYDFFASDFTVAQRAQLFATVNTFYDTFRYNASNYTCRAISNYQAGFFNAAGLIGILTRGTGGVSVLDNPRGEEIYQYWRNTYYELKEKPFFNRWFGAHGGFPEGIRYQALSASGIALTLLAQWEANGENLFPEFPWVEGLMEYWVHNTMPPRRYLSYRGFIPSPADATGTNPQPWKDLAPAYWIVHHIADLTSNAFRPKFKQWLLDLQVTNGALSGGIDKFLYWNDSLTAADWTTEPLSLPQLTNPLGGYGRVTMRSDWGTSAVLGDIWTTPAITDLGNGKEKLDKGSFFVQRDDDHLLVSTVAEATRAGNNAAYSYFHDRSTANNLDERFDQGVFYAQRIASPFAAVVQVRAGTAQYKQPGWDDCFPGTVVTSNPCRVDRYEDTGDYVYSRSVDIDKIYYSDPNVTTFFPIKGWDREIVFVRKNSGKVFFVNDRTRKQNKTTTPTATLTQHMSWNVGKTPTTVSYASGWRTEVVDGDRYKGALTHLSPPGATITTVNLHPASSLVHQLRVKPADHATEYNNWITVVDAASSQDQLEDVELFAVHSNVDAVRMGKKTIVGFMNYQVGGVPAFPASFTMTGMEPDATVLICSLAPLTTYKRKIIGNVVTIDVSGLGIDTTTTEAGCMTFTTKCDCT